MDHFKDKVAIVTGGASGIGRALCEALAQKGAVVIAADINSESVQQVAAAITLNGGRAYPAYLDVSQADEIEKLIEKTVSQQGQLDYMFNNAGILITGEVQDMTLEDWHRLFNINLLGVMYGTTMAYQVMVNQRFGHIVNIASLVGLIPAPMLTAYSTTKYGVVGLSTSLRAEAASLGINISVVCPGWIETGIYEASTVINAPKEQVLTGQKILPLIKKMDAAQAAQAILRGVERNQDIIVFPFHARLLYWLYRYLPSLLSPIGRKIVNNFRTRRGVQ
ncbi:MAG TPA: SDR family oxidoreductase [Thiotrichaceae bacterium]|nr:SDR family oxidoreductase [Thiotrichaceae bacterium]